MAADNWKFELGQIVRDVLTGFKGAVMARSQYFTGCDQYGVGRTDTDENGNLPKWEWLDESRLVVVKEKPIKLDDGEENIKESLEESESKRPGGPQQTPDNQEDSGHNDNYDR